MPCPDCGSVELGTAHVDGAGIVDLCAFCGHIEEASGSAVALFISAQEDFSAAERA